jgi:hypothetical protein
MRKNATNSLRIRIQNSQSRRIRIRILRSRRIRFAFAFEDKCEFTSLGSSEREMNCPASEILPITSLSSTSGLKSVPKNQKKSQPMLSLAKPK